jgi:hypothetical protein
VTRFRTVSLLAFILPWSLHAQGRANVQTLTVPTRNAGTCFFHAAQKVAGKTNAVSRSELVIKTATPGASREISVFRDKAGSVIGYAEISSIFTPPFASESDNIVATHGADGRVSGTWTHLTVVMSDSGLTKLDTASLRKMRDRAVRHSSQKPLDYSAQQKVRTLIKWFGTRCPA